MLFNINCMNLKFECEIIIIAILKNNMISYLQQNTLAIHTILSGGGGGEGRRKEYKGDHTLGDMLDATL